MTMVKPYSFSFSTQSLLSISISISNLHHPLSFSFTPFSKITSSILLPHLPSQSLPARTLQPIVCARNNNRRPSSSNRNMLHLASIIALNLKIFPEPFNSLIAEIARADWNHVRPEYLILNRGKTARTRNNLVWFVFVLMIVVAGFLSWRISELDLFLRALLLCLAGISLIRLCRGKKAVKEWFLGFFFGIVLMMSSCSKLGKEDMKFLVQRLRTCSPLAQIAIANRNRSRNGRLSK